MDNVGHLAHLHARDTTFVLVSPAPQANITVYKSRMGWEIPWFTAPADFARDFDATEWFALNVFIRMEGEVYRTYFLNGREVEIMGNAWSLLDLTPLGRQESWEDSPDGYPRARITCGAATTSTDSCSYRTCVFGSDSEEVPWGR